MHHWFAGCPACPHASTTTLRHDSRAADARTHTRARLTLIRHTRFYDASPYDLCHLCFSRLRLLRVAVIRESVIIFGPALVPPPPQIRHFFSNCIRPDRLLPHSPSHTHAHTAHTHTKAAVSSAVDLRSKRRPRKIDMILLPRGSRVDNSPAVLRTDSAI